MTVPSKFDVTVLPILAPSAGRDIQLVSQDADLDVRKRYGKEPIIEAIKQREPESEVDDICRKLGISTPAFYNWGSKSAKLEVDEAKRPRELEADNSTLKKLLA